MAHFPDKLAHLFQKVAQLWLILGFNLAHFRNFHLETLHALSWCPEPNRTEQLTSYKKGANLGVRILQ